MIGEKKRILWVDIAKAFAILSVIISHTLNIDMMARTMMFSIHMPLFFILSGFTTKLATTKAEFKKRLSKNLKTCIIPTLVVLIIFAILGSFIQTASPVVEPNGFSAIFQNIGATFKDFFIDIYPRGLVNASAVWFLIALFGAKTILDLINITFKSEKNGIIAFILGAIGICMGVFDRRLPCFIDLMFVAAMFMEVGILWRRYEKVIKKYTPILLIVAGFYWFSQTMRGVYLELWIHFYAGYEISILTAIAGSFLVANLAMMLEESLAKASTTLKKGISALVFLGKNTMLLYLVHCLDTSLFFYLWDFRDGVSNKRLYLFVVVRLVVDLGLFFMLYFLKKVVFSRGKKH